MSEFRVPSSLRINVDGTTFGLVLLFAVVIGAALALRPTSLAPTASPAFEGSSAGTQVAGGVIWAIGEAIFASILLGILLLWRRLPEWLQDALSKSLGAAVFVTIGAYTALSGRLLLAFLALFGTVIIGRALDEFGLWWIANNVLAIAIAASVGVIAGVILPPILIAAGLVGLTVYDYVFADRTDMMFALASWTVRRRLPALFIVPISMRMDWEYLAEAIVDDVDDNPEDVIQFGIGMADLALPAAFAVSLAQTDAVVPLVGALAGLVVACGRVSHKIDNGGGAGLPPIVSGTLGGWVLALLPGVISTWI